MLLTERFPRYVVRSHASRALQKQATKIVNVVKKWDDHPLRDRIIYEHCLRVLRATEAKALRQGKKAIQGEEDGRGDAHDA